MTQSNGLLLPNELDDLMGDPADIAKTMLRHHAADAAEGLSGVIGCGAHPHDNGRLAGSGAAGPRRCWRSRCSKSHRDRAVALFALAFTGHRFCPAAGARLIRNRATRRRVSPDNRRRPKGRLPECRDIAGDLPIHEVQHARPEVAAWARTTGRHPKAGKKSV